MNVCARFQEDLSGRIMEEFNKPQQDDTLEAYLERFENLKALVMQRNPLLPFDYFLDSFIGGLKPHLKSCMRAFHSQSLAEDVVYARLQEDSVSALLHVPRNSRCGGKGNAIGRTSSKGILATPRVMGG